MPSDRLCGLLIAAFGVLLVVFLVPAHVETVEDGWVRPETVPHAVAACFVLLGLLLAWRGGAPETGASGASDSASAGAAARLDARQLARALGFLLPTGLAVWAMARFGFLPVAPLFVLAVMALAGERRPAWLAAGALAGPAAIWCVVALLLDRPLPGP